MFILTAIKSIDFALLEGDRLIPNQVTQFVNTNSKTYK
jgi:hypothetical protein